MKTLLTLTGLLALTISLARAEDWKTTDGKSYAGVTVLSHDAAFVTIMYADGGARVALGTLPPRSAKALWLRSGPSGPGGGSRGGSR